jgi:hypothetical protein
MGNDFWIGRRRAAMTPLFMLSRKRPSTEGERDALFLPGCQPPPSRSGPDTSARRTDRGR